MAPRHVLRRLCVALVVASAIVGVPLVSGAPAIAAVEDDVSWGVRAADSPDQPRRGELVLAGAAGTRVSDAIVVTNYSPEPLSLDVYATDAGLSADGTAQAGGRDGADPASSASWISMPTPRVDLPAGGSVSVPFDVAIPDDAEPGDHTLALLTSWATDEEGVAVDRRLGIRAHIRVDGEFRPALAVSGLSLSSTIPADPFAERDATVSFTVTNTGNMRTAPTVEVALADLVGRALGGELRTPTPTTDAAPAFALEGPDLPILSPGESVDVVAELAAVGAPVIAMRAAIEVTGVPVAAPNVVVEPSAADAWMLAVSWPVLALIVVVLVLIVALIARAARARRAHRRTKSLAEGASAGVGEGDAQETRRTSETNMASVP